jgi:RES domain-containing protein
VLSESDLARALKRVRLIRVEGPFHRFADLWLVHQRLAAGKGAEVLRGLGAKINGGRFTPRGAFETLYVSTTAETARIEAECRITASGVISDPMRPFVHFLVTGRLQRVLDLTDDLVLDGLKTNADEVAAPWVLRQAKGQEVATQKLGRAAHATRRIEAILFPSTKHQPSGRCLAIFPDRLRRASILEIADETGLVKEKVPR